MLEALHANHHQPPELFQTTWKNIATSIDTWNSEANCPIEFHVVIEINEQHKSGFWPGSSFRPAQVGSGGLGPPPGWACRDRQVFHTDGTRFGSLVVVGRVTFTIGGRTGFVHPLPNGEEDT
jgi:hypothetical protein